ncbi:MAG: replicative helicase [Bacteriovoracaceae bacterium]|nr:replicative helicase [Bacteriovoracaceae bacterium]
MMEVERGAAGAEATSRPAKKIPPQNLDAERYVLGGMLIDAEAVDRVREFVEAKDFYIEAHRTIFTSVIELSRRGTPPDLLMVSDFLRAQNLLDTIGGSKYLGSLVDLVPSSANIAHYAKVVREKAVLRGVIQAGTAMIEDAFQGAEELTEILDKAEKNVYEIAHRGLSGSVSSIRDMVRDAFKKIQERFESKSAITGAATGFHGLDRILSGMQKSDLIIVAARPSVGKTAFALNMAVHMAVHEKVPTAVFSLEMSKEQLVQRMLCMESRVDGGRLRGGFLKDDDWPRLTHAASVLSDAPIYIDDTPGLSSFEMRAKCRRLSKSHGLGCVIVDYLQLMRVKGKVESREREIAEISMALKALAKELKIPVIALSQLNRSLESRQDKRPVLSDLRESGAIEQDADIIMFLYRDEVYHPDTEMPGIAEVIISKHRNGPTGLVKLAFLREFTRFENLADEEPIS